MQFKHTFAALLAAASCTTLSHAQPTLDDEPQPAPTAQPQPQPAPVQGAAQPGPTLVKYDEQGNMVRYPESVEIAALKVLDLTPEEKSKVDAVIAARNEKLDPIVRKNLSLVMRIQSIREEGLNQLNTNAIREMGQITPDFRNRSEYRNALAEALGKGKGMQFRALISMHTQSWIAFHRNNAKAKGTQDGLNYWLTYESHLTAGEDIRANLDRQLSEVATDTLSNIRDLIAPSQGQLTIIGPAIDDFKKKAETNSITPNDKVTLVRRIMQAQQEDERKDLLTKLLPPPIEVMMPQDGSTPKPQETPGK